MTMLKPKILHFKCSNLLLTWTTVVYFLLTWISAKADPQLLGAWPNNIKLSYALEVSRNKGLSDTDLVRMATIVMSLRKNISFESAQAKVSKLSLNSVKAWALTDFNVEYYDVPENILRELGDFEKG